jgi:hypothetical protein
MCPIPPSQVEFVIEINAKGKLMKYVRSREGEKEQLDFI